MKNITPLWLIGMCLVAFGVGAVARIFELSTLEAALFGGIVGLLYFDLTWRRN